MPKKIRYEVAAIKSKINSTIDKRFHLTLKKKENSNEKEERFI